MGDLSLRENVLNELEFEPSVNAAHIGVAAENGVITLSGHVGSYAEKLMANAGYGGPEVRMQQLKMRLRTIINALIDQGIHAHGMTESQAMDLMMNEGFQERSEASGKWRRAMLTSTQLSTYYAGTTELDQLREDYARRHGVISDEKAFNDRILSFGSPAPRYVRELMGV